MQYGANPTVWLWRWGRGGGGGAVNIASSLSISAVWNTTRLMPVVQSATKHHTLLLNLTSFYITFWKLSRVKCYILIWYRSVCFGKVRLNVGTKESVSVLCFAWQKHEEIEKSFLTFRCQPRRHCILYDRGARIFQFLFIQVPLRLEVNQLQQNYNLGTKIL